MGKDKKLMTEENAFVGAIRELGIKVDVLPTFEACSTFNFCNENFHKVAAFLLPDK